MYRAMHAAITNYVENNKQPTLVLLQSHWPVRRLVQQVAILNDFPIGMLTEPFQCPCHFYTRNNTLCSTSIVAIPFNTEENEFPALDWQRFAARHMCTQSALRVCLALPPQSQCVLTVYICMYRLIVRYHEAQASQSESAS